MTYADLLDHPDYLTWVRVLRESPDRALIYADWLDEHGFHERAEFIRVQCEMSRLYSEGHGSRPTKDHPRLSVGGAGGQMMPMCRACDSAMDLEQRERELLDVAAVQDWASIPASWDVTDWWFEFGFIAKIRTSAESWLRHGDAIYRYHAVREVELTSPVPIESREFPGRRADCWLSGRPDVRHSLDLDMMQQMRADATFTARIERELAEGLLRANWPGVKFTLPQIGVPDSIQMLSRRFRAGLAMSLTGGMIDTGSLRPSIPRVVRPTTSPRPESPPE